MEIVIDDRLPTKNGKLIYLRSTSPNEFWGALLEKAYAKLHGSYKALEGGLTIEAAVDFTGGIPEMIELERTEYSRERLFYIMSKADSRQAFMGCALTVSCPLCRPLVSAAHFSNHERKKSGAHVFLDECVMSAKFSNERVMSAKFPKERKKSTEDKIFQ